MKIGLGLYKNSLNSRNFTFAKQAGATHIVAHLKCSWTNGWAKPSHDRVAPRLAYRVMT